MLNFRRTIAIVLASLLILQILLQVSAQEDEKKEGKVLTLTFDEDSKTATETAAVESNTSSAIAELKDSTQAKPQQVNAQGSSDESEGIDDESEEGFYDEVQGVEESEENASAAGDTDLPLDMDEDDEDDVDTDSDTNPPPPQEIEPFLDDELEASMSASASIDLSSEEEVLSANALGNTPSSARPAEAQVTGCKTQGQIALTYSEGPSDVTAKIMRQLKKADARANFFVNATWLYTQQYAMVVQNMYNAGHLIGMTYRVANDDPSTLSDEDIRTDIVSNAHIIETLINVAPKYVRLHYTETKDVRTEGILRDLGFVIVGYNLDSQDYMKKEATGDNSIQEIYSQTFKKYKDTYDAKGSFISIQYDLPYTGSLNAVSHIINTIDEEGYTMVRLDGCLNDPNPYKKSANSTEYIQDKFSFQQSDYHQGQKAIVLDAQDTAEIEEDEEFKIQAVKSNAGRVAVFSSTLCVVGTFFALFL